MRLVLFLITASLTIAGEFTTALGDMNPYTISAITTDAAGNTYVVGSRQLNGGGFVIGVIAAVPPPVTVTSSFYSTDVFVTKLDPNGQVLFTDTFAGKGSDQGLAITLDPSGNIYIAGTTTSNDFPLSKPLQNQASATSTGFIIKLTNDGTTILCSTYFGGVLGSTSINSLATDSKGNLYLTGTTTSADFPHTAGMPTMPNPPSNTFSGIILAAISAAGDKILYAGAIFAGPIPYAGDLTRNTAGVGVAVDSSGNAYFSGNVGGGIGLANSYTGIVAKVPMAGAISISSLTHFVSAIATDPAGNVYVGLFGYQSMNAPIQVAISKLDPTSNILWTNTLSNDASNVNSLAVDASSNVWATGTAPSGVFPNAQGWSTGTDFLVGLNSTGSKTIFSQLYPAGTAEQSVALDPSGLVHVAGTLGFVSTINPNAAPTPKVFDLLNAFGGTPTDRISPAEVISIYGPNIGPALPAPGNISPVNGFFPTTFAGVQVQINGVDMPLLFVSPNQINAVVPMSIPPNAAATIRVINGTATTPAFPVWIAPSAPQAFPTVINQDGSTNSSTNPAKAGSVVTFYATGWQSNFSPLADGQVATTAHDSCAGACQIFTPSVSNPEAFSVLYGGVAPGVVAGVTQFNIRLGAIPGSPAAYTVPLTVLGPSSVSEPVWITP